jgi:hypothetical protein
MRINYLKSKGTTKPRKQIIEQEGLYRCRKCLMIFYSDIKYKGHDCYEGVRIGSLFQVDGVWRIFRL